MKTSLITDSFTITVTEIEIDFDDASNFEISFESTIARPYFESFLETEIIDDIFDGIDDDAIIFEFNVAHRHDSGLYYIIKSDSHGDYYDDYSTAIYAFGQPIIDFIDSICGLLKIPFYPNR